jgi:hypothetical protein
MNTQTQILAQYEAAQVEGRSKWCPRKGVYKVVSLYGGFCLGKAALMATVQWKAKVQDAYSDVTFEIQLESFKLNLDSNHNFLNVDQIVGKELKVETAFTSPENKSLKLRWSLIKTVDDLNKLITESSGIDISIDDDFGDLDEII